MMTAQEAIRSALSNLSFAAQQLNKDYPDDNLDLSSTLPVAELARRGFVLEVLDDDDADVLPRFLVRNNNIHAEIERCPFAPLVLLSGDRSLDVAEVVGVLQQADITALKMSDFEGVPDWHGIPAISWLFPERLSEALSCLDTLRGLIGP